MPKVESAADVWRVERHLDQLAKTRKALSVSSDSSDEAATSSVGLALMIETPKGVLQAAEIAAASENVVCLVMGTSDLTNELRAQHTPGREPMLASLGLCVLAARAHGVQVSHRLRVGETLILLNLSFKCATEATVPLTPSRLGPFRMSAFYDCAFFADLSP